jgi:predicted transposase YdaD
VLDIETIQQLMRWDVNVLRESPWYQEILEEGLKQGLQRGLQKGREEGREEGLEQGREQGILQGRREDILHLLRTRFYLQAEAEAELTDRLAQIASAAVLQTLLIAAAQAESLAAFAERLDQEAPPLSGG